MGAFFSPQTPSGLGDERAPTRLHSWDATRATSGSRCQGWVGGREGGIPSIELEKIKISISCFLEDIDPIFKIFENCYDRSQGLPGTRLFQTFQFLRC